MRRHLIIEQVVIAHRTPAPIDLADPSIRNQPRIADRLDSLTTSVRLLPG